MLNAVIHPEQPKPKVREGLVVRSPARSHVILSLAHFRSTILGFHGALRIDLRGGGGTAHTVYAKFCLICDQKVEKLDLSCLSEFFFYLFWLGHVHLEVKGCHRKVCISNVKK